MLTPPERTRSTNLHRAHHVQKATLRLSVPDLHPYRRRNGSNEICASFLFSRSDCFYAAAHSGLRVCCASQKWLPLPYQRGDWKFFVIIVVCEPCLFFICETLGMMYTSASQGGVIAACLPILMGVAGWIFLKEKPNVQLMLGILLAVIGVAGASWFGSTSEAAPHPLLGNLFMFCSILASSLYAVFTRRLTQRYPVLAIAAIQSIGGALFFLPLNFFFPLPESIHASSVFSVLYLSIMVGLVAYCGFNYSLQQLTAGEVGLFSSLVPIATCLFAFILLGERLSLLMRGAKTRLRAA